MYLGDTQLNLDTLHRYSKQLQQWHISNLLLYGCNVAAGDAGEEFIQRLSNLTGAKVATSKTLTGSAALNGDWNLDVTTGHIDLSLAFTSHAMSNYQGVLSLTKVGSEFQINTHTLNSQQSSQRANLSDGGFVVVWESLEQDGSGSGIYGQRYYANGTKNGSEFRVNSYTKDDQQEPSVTGLSDGGFVVIWASSLQDGSSWGCLRERGDRWCAIVTGKQIGRAHV